MFDVGGFIDHDCNKSQDFHLSLLYAAGNLIFTVGTVLLFLFPNPLHVPVPIVSYSLLVTVYLIGLVITYFRTAFIAAKMKNRGFMLWATIFGQDFILLIYLSTLVYISYWPYYIAAFFYGKLIPLFQRRFPKFLGPNEKLRQLNLSQCPKTEHLEPRQRIVNRAVRLSDLFFFSIKEAITVTLTLSSEMFTF